MKLKELESLMQSIRPFSDPKIELEQYPTGAHLASRLLYAVSSSYDELEGQVVLDLGCGTAMLSIGAAMLGAAHVLAVDVDADALEIARDNVDEYEDLPIDFILSTAAQLPGALGASESDPGTDEGGEEGGPGAEESGSEDGSANDGAGGDGGEGGGAGGDRGESGEGSGRELAPAIDVVITNPPFGTRRKGADVEFLQTAFALAGTSVYSLHKSSTRAFLGRLARSHPRVASGEVLAELKYDLPKSYAFHKSKSRDIAVDLWRFEMKSRTT